MNSQRQLQPPGPDAHPSAGEEYRLLIESFAQALWETDAAGIVVEDSPSWRAYTGQTLEQWLGGGWVSAVHPNDRSYALSQWQRAIQVQTPLNAEFRLQSPDGGWRWTNVRATAVPGGDGSIRKWVGLAIDISEKKRTEEALGQSEERFRAFVTATSDAVYRMSADWQEMHQLVGKSFLLDTSNTSTSWLEQYIPPQDQDQVQTVIDGAIRAKGPFELSHRVIQADGTLGWTFSRAIPILNQQGEIAEWFGTASDITKHKRAEDARRQSEEKYHTLFNSIDEGFNVLELITDDEGRPSDFRILETNRVWQQQTGIGDAVGKTLLQVTPNFERWLIDFYGDVARFGEAKRIEYYTEAVGRWYTAFATRIGEKQSRQIAVVFNDITGRRRHEANLAFLAQMSTDFAPLASAEEIMQRVGSRLASHLKLSRCNFAVVDEDADRIEVIYDWRHNEHLPGLLGVHRISDNLTNADRKQYSAVQLSVVADVRDSPMVNAPADVLRALGFASLVDVPHLQAGRWKFLLTVGRAEAGEWRDDELALIRELVSRIYLRIERARAEEALRESQDRLCLIIEGARGYAIFTTTLDGIIDSWNAGATEIFGWSETEILGQGADVLFTPEDRATGEPQKELETARTEGMAPDVRWHQRKDGSRVFINGVVQHLFDVAGQPGGCVKIGRDLTAQHAVEEALRASEQRLQRTVNVPRVGVLTFDSSGAMLSANDAFLDMMGYNRADFAAGRFTWQDFTPTEYVEESQRQMESLANSGLAGPYEREYFRKDGSRVWLMFVAADLGDGTIVEYAIDISDRKEAEKAVRQSEARFRTLSDAVPQVIWSNDGKGKANYFNQRWFDYSGLSLEESVGPGWQAIVHPDDAPASKERWQKAQEAGVVFDTECRLRAADGAYRWFIGRNVPMRDEGGNVTGWFGTATDIEELKQATDALAASEQRLRLATGAARMYAWDYDLKGGTASFSINATEEAGRTLPTLFDENLALVHPDDRAVVSDVFAKAAVGENTFDFEIRTQPAIDARAWLRVAGLIVRDERGEAVRAVGITQNITERKQAEEALRQSEERYRQLSRALEERVQVRTQELMQANQDLKRSNENLQQFAYVASHDLQEPLRKIQSFSDLLIQRLDGHQDDSVTDCLQRIASAGARMSTLIKDLLTYSRIATYQQTFGPVSLQTIMAGVLDTLDWRIEQTGAQVQVDALPMVNGDEVQLGQLFQNLLSNALKFVQPERVPQIHIQYVRRSVNELPAEVRPTTNVSFYHQISVGDQGVGFDTKYLDRIFQVFQRLHGKNQFDGTGVGLAICQRVVENHGGAITASSQPGEGATFCVYLPV